MSVEHQTICGFLQQKQHHQVWYCVEEFTSSFTYNQADEDLLKLGSSELAN